MLVALDEDRQIFNLLKILRHKVAIPVQVVEAWSDTNPEKFCVRILPMSPYGIAHTFPRMSLPSTSPSNQRFTAGLWKRSRLNLKMLAKIGQVADLLVNNGLALEVQCSSLPISRLQVRTKAYYDTGYQVVWLLGKDLWLKERLTNLHKQFLTFSMNMGFHLWELDDEKKELRLRYLIHEDLRGKVHCLTKVFPFGEGNLLKILVCHLPSKLYRILLAR